MNYAFWSWNIYKRLTWESMEVDVLLLFEKESIKVYTYL